jgi:hypothetical protein
MARDKIIKNRFPKKETKIFKSKDDEFHIRKNENIEILLKELIVEIRENNRPRVFFDIYPSKLNLLDMVLRNSGNSTAYNISCHFNPDIIYYNDKTLSDLKFFKNLPFLENNREVTFAFRSLLTIVNDKEIPKITTVTITYEDCKHKQYKESYNLDLERYIGTLMREKQDIVDIYKILSDIKKELNKIQSNGIIVKTPEDVKKEYEELTKNTENNV